MSGMRDPLLLKERSEYVKKVIAKSPSTHIAVEKLAKRLFLSERTIYKDLTS